MSSLSHSHDILTFCLARVRYSAFFILHDILAYCPLKQRQSAFHILPDSLTYCLQKKESQLFTFFMIFSQMPDNDCFNSPVTCDSILAAVSAANCSFNSCTCATATWVCWWWCSTCCCSNCTWCCDVIGWSGSITSSFNRAGGLIGEVIVVAPICCCKIQTTILTNQKLWKHNN